MSPDLGAAVGHEEEGVRKRCAGGSGVGSECRSVFIWRAGVEVGLGAVVS